MEMRTITIITKEGIERFSRIFKERNTMIMQDCNVRKGFDLIGIYLGDNLDRETMDDIHNKVKTLGKSIKMGMM